MMNEATFLEVLPQWQTMAQLFKLSSSLYLLEPSAESCKSCVEVGQILEQSHVCDAFPEHLQRASDTPLVELRQEFYDLFLVPMSPSFSSPFERDQRGEAGRAEPQLKSCYQAAGFDPANLAIPYYLRSLNRMDYMGFEVAFIAKLLGAAVQHPDSDQAQGLCATALAFNRHHLALWGKEYGGQLSEGASSHYFKGCGSLTSYLVAALDGLQGG